MSVNSFFQGIDLIPEMPDISNISFENIIDLPENVFVHDFESNNKFQETSNSFSIGRYNEKRPNMYEGELFEKTNRFIHMGIDIGAPVGTPVKSFYDGEIFLFNYNDQNLITVTQLSLDINLMIKVCMLCMGILVSRHWNISILDKKFILDK